MSPGSKEALEAGCTCPVLDNGHGRGYHGQPDVFVYNLGCPIHLAAFPRADAPTYDTDVTPEAVEIMRKAAGTFNWPADPSLAGAKPHAAFTRACYTLGINHKDMPDDERLHFHDLRHEGVSRLFEMGWDIPHVALVSGHRSWSSLQRYAQIRQKGDKFKDWKWLEAVTK